MALSLSQKRGNDALRLSDDDIESTENSEGPTSSVIRLPKIAGAARVANGRGDSAFKSSPPPLPPKPSFVRSSFSPGPTSPRPTSPSPPPLPPKPEKLIESAARQRTSVVTGAPLGLPDLAFASQVVGSPLPPPTRPLPPVPRNPRKPSYEEEGSWVPSLLDDRSFVDASFPPEPTIASDGDIIRSGGLDVLDASTLSLSDHLPNLKVPLSPPPFAAPHHVLASRYFPLHGPGAKDHDSASCIVQLSPESAEDAKIGAVVLSHSRLKRGRIPLPAVSTPIPWNFYNGTKKNHEVWNVLREYLTNVSLKSHGRARALQLLTGYVVSACLESTDVGIGVLSEIVRRMRGAERSERDGSVFTLLINIASHTSFVQRASWHSVEHVTRKVFSDVVEGMHGRQDDNVMWERALRCFIVLLKASDQHPSNDISTKCIMALSLHIGDLTHADVGHVLISNGLCHRLRRSREDGDVWTTLDENVLEEIGGIDTITTLFVDTTSTSATRDLFSIIFDVAVIDTVTVMTSDSEDTLREQAAALKSYLRSHEMSILFAHTFRVGPWPSFVLDVLRLLLFRPLSHPSHSSGTHSDGSEQLAASRAAFQEQAESADGSNASNDAVTLFRTSSSKYLAMVRAFVKCLNKTFCLQVLQRLGKMAERQSFLLSQRESMNHPREWKLLREIDIEIQKFLYCGDGKSSVSLDSVLSSICIATQKLTSVRSSMRGTVKMMELVIEFFTIKMPFSAPCGLLGSEASIDSVAKQFLRGRIVTVRDLLTRTKPEIFEQLLFASRERVPTKRVSENRQCLVEMLGVSKSNVNLLRQFIDDDDPAVAYRASEIVSKYCETLAGVRSPPSTAFDER